MTNLTLYSFEHSDERNSIAVNLKKTCFFEKLSSFSLRFGAVGETRTLRLETRHQPNSILIPR